MYRLHGSRNEGWTALLKKRPHAWHPSGDCCSGTAWAFARVRTPTTPRGAGESGAVLARRIGLELPDTAAVTSMPRPP